MFYLIEKIIRYVLLSFSETGSKFWIGGRKSEGSKAWLYTDERPVKISKRHRVKSSKGSCLALNSNKKYKAEEYDCDIDIDFVCQRST